MKRLNKLAVAGALVAASAAAVFTYSSYSPRSSSSHRVNDGAKVEASSEGAACAAGVDACGAHATKGAHALPAARIEGRPQMLVFSSKYCPACKRMAPVVDSALAACGAARDVSHVDVDDDAGEALAATYAVSLLPSFVSIDASGNEVARLTGVQPQTKIESALEEIRGTRCASLEKITGDRPM